MSYEFDKFMTEFAMEALVKTNTSQIMTVDKLKEIVKGNSKKNLEAIKELFRKQGVDCE